MPKTVDTRKHCKVGLRACNNLPQPPKTKMLGRGLRKIVACSQPYLACSAHFYTPSPFTHAYISKRMRNPDSGSKKWSSVDLYGTGRKVKSETTNVRTIIELRVKTLSHTGSKVYSVVCLPVQCSHLSSIQSSAAQSLLSSPFGIKRAIIGPQDTGVMVSNN